MNCMHPGCKCSVPANSKWGNYCSAHCRHAGDHAEPQCTCGHPDCRTDTRQEGASFDRRAGARGGSAGY
jgi:hypothetical protein